MAEGKRIGIDLGGTKIAGIVIGPGDATLAYRRLPSPREDYAGTMAAIAEMVTALESEAGLADSIGIGMPGSISPATGLVQNANSTWLNGRPFAQDLGEALQRPVRLANDANCFALSEWADGHTPQPTSLFGVILGTGCGGGLIANGGLVDGPRGIAGEWGHTPLPWPEADEVPGPECWCGLKGCLETWISGPALAADYARATGETATAAELAASSDNAAAATLDRHLSRLARGLAVVINIADPELIVLGGGLSSMDHLYGRLPDAIGPFVFADHANIRVVPPRHGDDSGVRGAARLWDGV